jgi:acetylornithine deacetylase/succinyl-diaminopimelate desuccinylase-like protein
MRNHASVLAVLLLFVLAAVAIAVLAPPRPVPETAPATEFSAARAMRHLEAIAAHPHSIESPENAAVREYILATLASMGLEPEVQETTAVSSTFGAAGTVRNVVARLAGTRPGPALLLAAHYDSVPSGPGAGDDASGVAAILETLRALRASPRCTTTSSSSSPTARSRACSEPRDSSSTRGRATSRSP